MLNWPRQPSSNWQLFGLVVIVSSLISLFFIQTRTTINTDAVVYLAAAERMQALDLRAALEITPFIFLSGLIALLAELSGLSLVAASDVLNTFFLTGMVVAFLLYLKSLGADRMTLWIGALLLLLHPGLAGYRDAIFRDSGFWMMGLLSLYWLEQYRQQGRLRQAAGWTVSLVLASFFRPEALALMLTPLLFALDRSQLVNTRWQMLIWPFGMLLLLGLLLILGALLSGNIEVFYSLYTDFVRYFRVAEFNIFKPDALVAIFPSFYPEEYGWLSALLAMLPALFEGISRALSWPILVLFGFLLYKRQLGLPESRVYRYGLLVSLLIPLIFLLVSAFLTSRYATFFALFLMLLLPFAIRRYIDHIQVARKHLIAGAMVVLVLFVDTFISFGYSDAYVSEAIKWVQAHVEPGSRVISNERKISYSTGFGLNFQDSEEVFWGWETSSLTSLVEDYDYFIEDTNWDMDELMVTQVPGAREVARFTNERGNRAVIYQLP